MEQLNSIIEISGLDPNVLKVSAWMLVIGAVYKYSKIKDEEPKKHQIIN